MSKIPHMSKGVTFEDKDLIKSIKEVKGNKFIVISAESDVVSDSKVVIDLEVFIQLINDLGAYKDTVKKVLEDHNMDTTGLD